MTIIIFTFILQTASISQHYYYNQIGCSLKFITFVTPHNSSIQLTGRTCDNPIL